MADDKRKLKDRVVSSRNVRIDSLKQQQRGKSSNKDKFKSSSSSSSKSKRLKSDQTPSPQIEIVSKPTKTVIAEDVTTSLISSEINNVEIQGSGDFTIKCDTEPNVSTLNNNESSHSQYHQNQQIAPQPQYSQQTQNSHQPTKSKSDKRKTFEKRTPCCGRIWCEEKTQLGLKKVGWFVWMIILCLFSGMMGSLFLRLLVYASTGTYGYKIGRLIVLEEFCIGDLFITFVLAFLGAIIILTTRKLFKNWTLDIMTHSQLAAEKRRFQQEEFIYRDNSNAFNQDYQRPLPTWLTEPQQQRSQNSPTNQLGAHIVHDNQVILIQ